MRTQTIGFLGEDMVADYYKNNGFFIAERNYISPYGEIDIVAENENTVVFCEVKTRCYSNENLPREAIDNDKVTKIKLTAENFLQRSHLKNFLKVRYDVAEIILNKNDNFDGAEINVIENAF